MVAQVSAKHSGAYLKATDLCPQKDVTFHGTSLSNKIKKN